MKHSVLTSSLLATALLLSACGGSGSNGGGETPPPPPAQPVAFSVVSTTPASGATAVARAGAVSATLSSAADLATVDSASAQLVGPEGNLIPTVAAIDGATLKLTPQGGLLPGGTSYTAKLSTAIKSTSGQSLATAASVPFTTAAQQWDAQATFLGDNQQRTGMIDGAIVVASPDGSSTVFWQWSTWRPTTGGPIYASRLAPGASTWSEPQTLASTEFNGTLSGLNPVVAPNGNIYVGWASYMSLTGSSTGAYVAIFDAAAGKWTTTELSFPGEHRSPLLSVDGKGNVTALTLSNSGEQLYASRLAAGSTTWSSVQTVTDLAGIAPDTIIEGITHKSDKDGNVIAAWRQREGERPGLYTSRYAAGAGTWSAPQLIDARLDSEQIALVVDEVAGAVLAWVHLSPDVADHRYIATTRAAPGGTTWGPVTQISDQVVQVGAPRLAVSPAGAVTAVYLKEWAQLAVRSAPGSQTWDRANTQVALPASLFASAGQPSVDGAGNLTMLWSSNTNVRGTARYSASSGKWETLTLPALPGPDGQPATSFGLNQVGHRNGEIVTVWAGAISSETQNRQYVGVRRFR